MSLTGQPHPDLGWWVPPVPHPSRAIGEGKQNRIGIEVSSSNFPRFDRNPNTGGTIAEEEFVVPARQTILHDREHQSRVVLPVSRG